MRYRAPALAIAARIPTVPHAHETADCLNGSRLVVGCSGQHPTDMNRFRRNKPPRAALGAAMSRTVESRDRRGCPCVLDGSGQPLHRMDVYPVNVDGPDSAARGVLKPGERANFKMAFASPQRGAAKFGPASQPFTPTFQNETEQVSTTDEFDEQPPGRYPAANSLVLLEHPLHIARCGARFRLTTQVLGRTQPRTARPGCCPSHTAQQGRAST